MKKKRKTKKLLFSKKYLLLFSICYAFLLVLGSTYSWQTMADEKVNRHRAKKLDIHISGRLGTESLWKPQAKITRNIGITNPSEAKAIVRISLEEVLLNFEVDTIDNLNNGDDLGNGNLKETNHSSTMISIEDSNTWRSGNTLENAKGTGHYYIGNQRVDYPITYDNITTTRDAQLNETVQLNWNTAKIETSVNPGNTDYWLYENGYFYYSEILKPGDTSSSLLLSTELPQDIANDKKASLYEIKAKADGYQPGLSVLMNNWSLNITDEAYNLLIDKVF